MYANVLAGAKQKPQTLGYELKGDLASTRPVDLLARFMPFQEDGFTMLPKVVLPVSVANAVKRFGKSKKVSLDGPTAWQASEFLESVLKQVDE
jgi:hypothetical protein